MSNKVICSVCADIELTEEEVESQKKNTRRGEEMCYFCRCDTISVAMESEAGKDLGLRLPDPKSFGRTARSVKAMFKKRKEALAAEIEKEDLKKNPAKVPEKLLREASTPSLGKLTSSENSNEMTVIRHELEPGNYIEFSIKYPVPPVLKEGMEMALKQLWEDSVTAVFAFKTDSNMVLDAIGKAKAKDQIQMGFQQPGKQQGNN